MNIASESITEKSFSSKYTNNLASNSVDISNAISSALAGEKERSKCQLNLIIHNLGETPPSEDGQTWKDQDTQMVLKSSSTWELMHIC